MGTGVAVTLFVYMLALLLFKCAACFCEDDY